MDTRMFLMAVGLMTTVVGFTQISFKTEYFGNSQYWHEIDDDHREKVGKSKGSAMVYQANAKIPLSIKTNENKQTTIWAITAGGAYARLDNKNFDDYIVSEIMNLQLGVINLTPLNKKWSLLSVIGGGVYAPFSNLSKTRLEHILGNTGVVFIKHLKPNLDLGGGLALNNTFGYPMVFPVIYLNWSLQGNYYVDISMMTGLDIKAGRKFNKFFSLNFVVNVNGQLALLEKKGKEMLLSHQYTIVGLSFDVNLGKHLNFSLTTGVNCARPLYFEKRNLRSLFKSTTNYYFGVSPYMSAGIIIK